MSVKVQLQQAVEKNDSAMAGRIAERLRLIYGLNFNQIYRLAHDWTGIDLARWDSLMYEADWEDGYTN
jgi:hypothetical protein